MSKIPLSFYYLGSQEIEQQVIDDLEELLGTADKKKVTPMFITVGSLFMQISSVQSVIYELNIQDWDKEFRENTIILKELVNEKLAHLYSQAEKGDGLLEMDEPHGLPVIFNPEDYYMSLICKVDEPCKENSVEDATEKEPFRFLRFKDDEILPKLLNLITYQ